MHLKYFVNFYFLNIVLGSFTSTPPSSVTKCTGGDIQLTWAYVPPTGKSAILVNWKKDGDAILLWNVGPNTLIYGTGYNASMLSHDNTNGQITLVNSDESSTGIYTCEATYSSPVELAQSNQTDLKVFDTITTSMNCECGINGIQCDLPSPITEVTINDTLQSLPYLPQNVSSYMVCMAGDAAVCLANNIDSCEQIDLCPKGSTSSQSGSEWWKCFLIVVGSVCGIIIILYVNYRCSNKNCKTHAKCWKCSGVCHSDYPLVTRNSSEEWNGEHYCCCLNHCCPIEGCNKNFCSCFLCCGCCLIEFPEKRVKENGQPLTRPPQRSSFDEQKNNTKRKKKKKKAKHSVKENNEEPNPPVEKHAKEEKAVHTATGNNTKGGPNPSGERRISLDSLNSKSNKIYPKEDKQVNNTKKLDPILLKSGNVEIANSSTPQPLSVLPPIDQKAS